jgi:hypothetical protein
MQKNIKLNKLVDDFIYFSLTDKLIEFLFGSLFDRISHCPNIEF